MSRTPRPRFGALGFCAICFGLSACLPLYRLDSPADVSPTDEGGAVTRYGVEVFPEMLIVGEKVWVTLEIPGSDSINLKLVPFSGEQEVAQSEVQGAWFGKPRRVAKIPRLGQPVFFANDGWASAHFPLEGRVYRLRSISRDRGVLEVFDIGELSETDDPPTPTSEGPTISMSPGPAVALSTDDGPECLDPPDEIKIMVMFTRQAACHAALEAGDFDSPGACENIEPEDLDLGPIRKDIEHAIDLTNVAYVNSNVNHRLHLVHTEMVGYQEPADGVDAAALVGEVAGLEPYDFGTEDYVPYVYSLSEQVGADLVTLVYERGSPCGWANPNQLPHPKNNPFEQNKSVFQRDCVDRYHILAHETGHNLGALHHWEDYDPDGGVKVSQITDYTEGDNFGHLQPEPNPAGGADPWVTVMSYASACPADKECSVIAWFSNPDVNYPQNVSAGNSDPTGVAWDPNIVIDEQKSANNARVLNRNGPMVSQYRCEATKAGPDVWMKDHPFDDGTENGPPTPEPMWRSPYIWVRHQKDNQPVDGDFKEYEHEHAHENPRFGQDNFVYVKLHNTGTEPEAGRLLVYYADASMNLDEPESWELVNPPVSPDDRVTMEPGTMDVVEVRWTKDKIPGTGHYCLLARWDTNEALTPLAFTNGDGNPVTIDAAVHADNDLVWRNVNIIDLGQVILGDEPIEEFVLEGGNDGDSPESYYLLVTARPIRPLDLDWQSIVPDITLALDPRTRRSSDFEVTGLTENDFGFGFTPDSKATRVTMGPFELGPGETTTVKVRVTANPGATRLAVGELANPAYYDVTIVQVRGDPPSGRTTDLSTLFKKNLVVGGVSYLLRVPATITRVSP